MIIEIHAIQNIAPANLNRDDTGAPKEAIFGGTRRARVSSQSWKRAMRTAFSPAFTDDELAWRTKRLTTQTIEALTDAGRDPEEAHAVVAAALTCAKVKLDKAGHTTMLWLVARNATDTLRAICEANWDDLTAKKTPPAVAKDVANAITDDVFGGRAVDIALFGRMLTDAPSNGTVEAAAQVAHALSTHAIETEFDYFTAVDDLLGDDESGAGMVGTIEFNSACLYRYANLDTAQLVENLGGDVALARRAAEAFLDTFVTSMPGGKQNTFAAHNPPSIVFAVVRPNGTWNLANAFVDPVRPARDTDLVAESVARVAQHWGELRGMYGDPTVSRRVAALAHLSPVIGELDAGSCVTVPDLIAATAATAFEPAT